MVRSIAHIFFHVAGRHPDRPAFKERGGEDGPVWTYGELARAVKETALGFSTLGVRPGDRVGLFADNSIRWILSDLAVLSLGAADVPRGTDTSPAEVDYLIRHSGARVVILQDRRVLDELAPTLSDIADLQCIVLQEGSFKEGDPRPVLSLDEVRERGRRRLDEGARVEDSISATRGTDTATIVYTSGTTGKPKGVVLTHDNVLHNIRAVPGVVDFRSDDVFLSILPAWHMFERLIEYAAISKACLTIYTTKKTIKRDLVRERPTVLAAVPRVWEILYDEARKRLKEQPAPMRLIATGVLNGSELYRASRRIDPSRNRPTRPWARLFAPVHALGERLVFAKFRGALGGNLKVLVSGGGSLPTHVDRFFDVVGLPLLNGYGLTETAPLVAVRRRDRPTVGTVGLPIPSTLIEVRDPDGRRVSAGQVGVIHVKGPQVMSGYYKDRETTARVLTTDGWFDTGDLGRLHQSGELEITGRAKDTIVLRGGENVEPEPIENALRLSELIDQVIVVGQDRKQLGALIVLDHDALAARLPVGPDGRAVDDEDERRALVRREIDRLLHRARGFKSCEQVRRFTLQDAPFSIESGELTETMKPKRHVILERRGDALAEMFAE